MESHKKDLVLGVFKDYTDFEVIRPWISSIKRTDFDGDVVLIVSNTTDHMISCISELGAIAVKREPEEPNNIYSVRFRWIYDFLKNTNYNNVLVTDVKDVIFQENPSNYMGKNLLDGVNLVASTEAIKIKDEKFARENIGDSFGEYFLHEIQEEISCCAGVIAGTSDAIENLSFYIYEMSVNLSSNTGASDQAAFNLLLRKHPWRDTTKIATLSEAWALNAGTTNPSDAPERFYEFLTEPPAQLEGDVVVNSDGVAFAVVHQYDRNQEWDLTLREKYRA